MRFIQFSLLAISLVFSAAVFAGSVNVNTANAKTLASAAKGIGQKKAEAVVRYRNAHGDFAEISDLKKVKGIGPKTVQENRSKLTTGNSPEK